MKLSNSLVYLLSGILLLSSCQKKGATNETNADSTKKDSAATSITTTNESFTYKIDTVASVIKWKGKKITGEGHNGTIKLAACEVKGGPNELLSGTIVINMSTITDTDLTDQKKNADMVGHLKSDDFFAVAKFPTAAFTIITIHPDKVDGQLTLKGISDQLNVPATIAMEGNQLKVTGKTVMDRTKWDVKYGSGKFFKGLGDKLINDDVELEFEIVANK